MKSLVTCDQVGGSLEMWLKTASPEQLQDFYTQLLKHIKNCDGTSLVPSDKLATCKNVEAALKEHGKNLNQGENLPADAEDCTRPLSVCGMNNMLNADSDNAAKQAVVHAVTDTLRDDAGKRSEFAGAIVSRQSGNLIQQRDDGLYYGIEAKKELRNLYVSNFGNDETGDGSEAKPFATIGKAISVIEDIPAWYTINLHAGHEFEVNGTFYREQILLSIVTYASGPEYPKDSPFNIYYRGYCAEAFPRPKLNFRVRTFHDERIIRRDSLHVSTAYVEGVAIQVFDEVIGGDVPTYNGWFAGVINSKDEVILTGCTFELMTSAIVTPGGDSYRTDAYFRCPRLVWANNKILSDIHRFSDDTHPNALIAAAEFTNSVIIYDWVAEYLDGRGGAPNHKSLISNTYVQAKNLKLDYLSRAQNYDAATKRVFGLTLNWDPFANS